MTNAPPPATPSWQPDKILSAHDRIWVITDVESDYSSYYPWSEPQELFKVGIYDLTTRKIGFARFGRDTAYALLKVGLAPPPWNAPLSFAVEIRREGADGEPKGRHPTQAVLTDLDASVVALAPMVMKVFAQLGHRPNASLGMWDDLDARAKKENATERAALSMSGIFKASDVKGIVGKTINVSSSLRRLVEEGRLVMVSAKKYIVAPLTPIDRKDWTG